MATIGATVLTLSDWAKRLEPDGKVAKIVELLGQTNDVLIDMLFKEGNLPTGHRTTVRTGLPAVAWRLLNNGVAAGKSTTAQIDEQCGMLEAWSEVDKDLAELNGNTNEFRLSEATSFLEAMNQEAAQTLFYGNSGVNPEEFTGMTIRYSSTAASNGQNIIKAGGAGADNSSIWLMSWGENTLHGIFPKASKAGIIHEDLGLVTVENANGIGGARMRAYRDHWQWKLGIALRDWRYAVRICNIDISLLTTETTAADLVKNMAKAMHRLPYIRLGKPVFYMNRTVFQFLDLQSMARTTSPAVTNTQFTSILDAQGQMQWSFRGIPIRIVDALLETEALVT